MTDNPLILLIAVLAAYRITRFLIEDELFDTPREWLYTRFASYPKITYALGCYWCLGFWVSIFVVVCNWLIPGISPWIFAPFAISAVVGLIDQKAR